MADFALLAHKAYELRRWSIIETTMAGSGHPTTCLSAADIVAVLFFHTMQYDPRNPHDPNNDRFILSKGHASALLYAAWHEAGVLSADDLFLYRQINSVLEGHPTLRFPYNEAATGSLGMGLSIGAGMAIAARMDNRNFRTYVLLGDSEMTEGSIWEAVEIAAHYKLNNLIGIIDANRLGQSTATLYGHDLSRFVHILEPFGWHVITVDGHDIPALIKAFDAAHNVSDKPVMIIAHTFKGHGIPSVEDKEGYHGKPFGKKEVDAVLTELREQFPDAVLEPEKKWHPRIPTGPAARPACKELTLPNPSYKPGEKIATRKAFGQALRALGTVCANVVSLDAEVKNSTYADIFEKAFPERFVECFIAEQNMVSMAVGIAARGFMPFVSTFGAFLSRAHDQIRMAAIGQAKLHIVGSHAGISIGKDGPSQMALEDIALMRALPGSVVLYPSDAVSTYKLMGQMARYENGITYLRTTRAETPVIYEAHEEFPIGGCKVLHESDKDWACVIGAGITLFEALRAYEHLRTSEDAIHIAVIDLYSVKPLDVSTIMRVARAAKRKIITVEDHYRQGGLGEAVSAALSDTDITVHSLAVDALPRSGSPEELLALHKIDASAIVKAIRSVC